jgi:hypothetical protein
MAKAKASTHLEALPTSPSLAQTLPSDAVLDALKLILLGAPLNEVLTTITRLIEAHSTGMLDFPAGRRQPAPALWRRRKPAGSVPCSD